MSSQQHHHQQTTVPAPCGDIEHAGLLSEDIGALYLSDEYSDVTLLVAGQRLCAHKIILAARSQYFRALLFGGLKESTQTEIELKDASARAFGGLLKYIYTGRVFLTEYKEEEVIEILGLAHLYDFSDLQLAISEYLRRILSAKNACPILNAALLYGLESLTRVCHEYIDERSAEVIPHESFLRLSGAALNELVSRDSFYAPEIDVFLAVKAWIEANPEADGKSVLSKVRLSLISVADLLNTVRPTGLVSPEAVLDAIAARTQTRDSELNYRGRLLLGQNVAHPLYGAEVLQGEMRSYLLDGDTENYDMERGYTRHTITTSQEYGILIKLGTQYIINHAKMLLWDRDMRSYSYYLEVSVDQKDWARVIDHTEYFCRSWQYLYFEPRVVRYVRIVGTNNTVNKVFHVVSFEAYYTNHEEKLSEKGGFIVPAKNVATLERSAVVTEGVSRYRNALLNGDTQNYNWDSGYTCHQLGSGQIQVQLGQPYVIDSMRLLLWDCDDRSYAYYIDVSGDGKSWTNVAQREFCQSWQTIEFQPARPVVFIRIVGTHNTANEVFHCVHFECPAQAERRSSSGRRTTEENVSWKE